MFTLGLLIGIYAYCIFSLGLLSILYIQVVILFTLTFVGVTIYFNRRNMGLLEQLRRFRAELKKDRILQILLSILFVQALINLIGALGPELGFDALWYHLTLPKLYLINHSVSFVPGGLLYYSAMPKLLELLYVGGLAFGSEVFPKLIHFGFGILILFLLYKISRKFFNLRWSLLTLVIFYSNLVIGWQSISAYIDLGRTFFELLSFYALLEWIGKKEKSLFFYSAIFMGFAIMTKLLALGSLLIICILIFFVLHKNYRQAIKSIISYCIVALLIPLPWFIFSLVNTGNSFYPFFTKTYPVTLPFQLLNPLYFFSSFWNLFLYSPDPLNPFYLIILPFVLISFKKMTKELLLIFTYGFLGLLLWYITPNTGGGRFIVPYLPIFSIMAVATFLLISQKTLKQFLFIVAIAISISSILYRGAANAKFIPAILGKESKAKFLEKHLNFSFGDFYDTDGYFKSHIKSTDKVLLFGFHNEYYINFPFIDSSWVKRGDLFNYIASQNSTIPNRFRNWTLVYVNPITHVSLFWAGGTIWSY